MSENLRGDFFYLHCTLQYISISINNKNNQVGCADYMKNPTGICDMKLYWDAGKIDKRKKSASYEMLSDNISKYKVGAMVYRCLHGQATRYLADHLIAASDAAPRRRRLRSANRNRLTVPHCRLSTYGCRAFDYAGPTVCNSLPDELRNSDSKRFLKNNSL